MDSVRKASPPRERPVENDDAAVPTMQGVRLDSTTPEMAVHDGNSQGEEGDEEELDDKYGPICKFCGVGCFNVAGCGCTKCTVQDKQMMVTLFFLVVLIIANSFALELAEAKAVSGAEPGVIAARMATSSLLSIFKTIFEFLYYGVLAMIGSTRTHSKDEEEQAEADRKTGKVVQMALLAAVITSALCIALSFGLYDTYLRGVFALNEADTETLRPYLNMVAPTLVLFFISKVLSALCLQTGGLAMVVLDILIDSILGLVLFLSWAKDVSDIDTLIERIALVNVVLAVFKFLVYAVYVARQTSRFHLLDTSTPADLPYSEIGVDLFWQWLTNMCSVGSQQLSMILVVNLGKVELLSYSACNYATFMTSLPADIFNWYIIAFGSRYIGDKRYEQFWGLSRAMIIAVAIVSVAAIPVTPSMIKHGVDIISKGKDRPQVEAYVETTYVGASTLGSIILRNFMMYLSNCFRAWTKFKQQALCYCFGLVCAIPVFVAAYIVDDFAVMMSGMTMWWLASLVALALVWVLLPEALHPERKYLEEQNAEAKLLLQKEGQLAELQAEIKALRIRRDRRYLLLSETMGWNAARPSNGTNVMKRQGLESSADLPLDYDGDQDANQVTGEPRRSMQGVKLQEIV